MRIDMKITPLRTGTSEPVDEPRLFPCPPDLEPDQVRSFLVQFFEEEPVELAWTTTARHERINIGWIFRTLPGIGPTDGIELLCVPVVDTEDGSQKPLFEMLAHQRQDFEQLAAADAINQLSTIDAPMREYRPAAGREGE